MAKRLKKSEVNAILESYISQSVGWSDSKLSREREKVLDYYNGKLPKQQHAGSSPYVSTDVYNGVETMKAQLLETFASGYDNVKFTPRGPEDVEDARIATEYCSFVIHQQNPGFKIYSDTIHDGLTARVGIAKVFWEEIEDYEDEEFEDLSYEEVQGIAAQEDVETLDSTIDEETMLYSGTLRRKIDRSKVCIDVVPPEEFIIDEDAVSIDTANLRGHLCLKTRSELIEMGFDPKKVMKLPTSSKALTDWNAEADARLDPVSNGLSTEGQQEATGKVALYELYVYLDMEGDGSTKLYKVMRAESTILDIEEMGRHPFFPFVPLPIPHSFFGNNFAARIIPTQNANTVLTRSILDHSALTNNPRYQVLKGGLVNPRELLDNRLGGLVNVTRPDAVTPLPQAPLNQFVFPTLELLKTKNEEATGISSLSQGLNKDAVSQQNSAALVDQLVTLSQQRQKIIARNFAYNFLVPLYIEVYRLVLENEKRTKIIEISGNFVEVDPKRWAERADMSVSFYLGYGEKEREVGKYVNAYSMLAQDPSIQPMFTVENRYNLIVNALRESGLKNTEAFITPPNKVQPPSPDPASQAEVQAKMMQAQAQMLTAEAAVKKVEVNAELEQMKLMIQQMAQELNAFKVQTDAARKDAETANRIDIAQRELQIAEQQPPENTRAIFSANS
jgi:hypothetical protein